MSNAIRAKDRIDQCTPQDVTGSNLSTAPTKRALNVKAPDTEELLRQIRDGEVGSEVPLAVPYHDYNEANALARFGTAVLFTYTVPAGKRLKLGDIFVYGNCMGLYKVFVDSNVIDKKSTYYTKYYTEFNFSDKIINAGEVLKVEITNNGLTTGDFNLRIQGDLKDA